MTSNQRAHLVLKRCQLNPGKIGTYIVEALEDTIREEREFNKELTDTALTNAKEFAEKVLQLAYENKSLKGRLSKYEPVEQPPQASAPKRQFMGKLVKVPADELP